MSRFLQVYIEDVDIDNMTLIEDLDLTQTHVEESVSETLTSVKDKLMQWFKWIKDKVLGFFKGIKDFIVKIAGIAIKQVHAMCKKCKELIDQAKQKQESAKEAAYTKEELNDPHLKDFLWTSIGSKVAGGFNGASFDDEFLYSVNNWFKKLKKAALENDRKVLDDAKYVENNVHNMDSNYYMIQVLGSNVQIQTHEFDEAFTTKCIDQAKEVCTNVVTKVQNKFDAEIREIENKVKSGDITSDHSAFIQTCINKMANLSNYVKKYIMNKIFTKYIASVQRAAYLRSRYATYKAGAEIAGAFADAVSKKWSITSALKSLFSKSPAQKPAIA